MKRDVIHRNFLGAIEKKVPDKSALVEILMETLCLEKGAVYRRLRDEVPFTFFEIVHIAEKLGISLNSFIYPDSARIKRFELAFIEYAAMSEMDYKQWEDFIHFVGSAKNDPYSEVLESTNMLPVCIYAGFEALTKYHLFKYQYLLHSSESRIPFDELDVSDRLQQIFRSYCEESKKFANTTYILDYMIFRYLVTDIRFFSDIRLISAADVALIRKDFAALLDYIEALALKGSFKETGNPVYFYISEINLDANYICIQINDAYVSLVRQFILNSVESDDQSSFRKIKDWIQSQKKSATLITQSGAVYRADFFEKQRQIIAEL